MHRPLISIVIDNFNYERFLAQSVDSALAQTYDRIEVIVVDDLSTDGSRVLLAGYGDQVTLVLQPVNRGQGSAFNAGFRASRGDIVMFLDADDWLYPQAAEKIAAAWQPPLSKIHFRLDLVDTQGAAFDVHPALEVRLDAGDVMPLLLESGRYETVVTSGNAFARSALEPNLPMPEEPFRIAADGYLATVVPFHGPVGCIEERLGAYRVHGTNAYAQTRTSEPAGELCGRIRKFLAHDAHKDTVLRRKAASAGLPLDANPQLRDANHLELRLASLRLDPAGHPYPADGRASLACRGVIASRRARLRWTRRALLAFWFLVTGFMPRGIALAAIGWKLQPSSRSMAVDKNMKRLRRLLS